MSAAPESGDVRIALDGGRNFRDLGGWPTADGRRVRRGLVFRSGSLGHLTDTDLDRLEPLGIGTICDLRGDDERAREPSRWHGNATFTHWAYDAGPAAAIGRALAEPGLSVAKAIALNCDFYARLPLRLATQTRDILRLLGRRRLPLLLHCSAGKDRTGVVSAVILAILGVAQTDVVREYTLTAMDADYEEESRRHPERTLGFEATLGLSDRGGALMRFTPEIRGVLLAALPEYIGAALDAVIASHGSAQAFAHAVMGIGPQETADIRNLLLE